jgi:hypothetical protein
MKKIITLTTITILSLLIYYLVSIYTSRKVVNIQPIEVKIGDKVEYTSGVSVEPNASKAAREVIDLIDRGTITFEGFSFVPPGNGSIVVELQNPYEDNKTKALDWLKNNGYSNINPSSLLYKEIK